MVSRKLMETFFDIKEEGVMVFHQLSGEEVSRPSSTGIKL